MIDYNQLIQWIFFGVIGFCFVTSVKILSSLRTSVDALNIKMATIIEKITYHEKEIDYIKSDIKLIRDKKT